MKKIYLVLLLLIVTVIQISFSQSRKDIEKEWALYKNNKVKAKFSEDINGKEIIHYDINGRAINGEYFLIDGAKSYEIKYEYDNNSNLLNMTILYTSINI